MAREDRWITDDELLTRLARVAPADRHMILDFAWLMDEAERAGKAEAFYAAAKALFARARAHMAKN